MLEAFCLRLAAGLAGSLLALPAGDVQPRFHRIHLLIVLALTASAAAMAWTDATPELFWLAVGLSAAGSLIGALAWSFQGAPGGTVALFFAAGGALFAGIALKTPTGAASWTWALVDHATSAGLLGASMTAMLLGHWYLIAPTLSIRPLLRLLAVLFGATALRLVVAAAALWPVLSADTMNLDTTTGATTWMWLGVRWGVGLAGPLVLGWMAWQAARIRSTQSATGILYVVVIFTFLGELTDELLQEQFRSQGSGVRNQDCAFAL